MSKIIRVLVVDDSAYVRKVVKEMLQRSPFIEVVGVARNGLEALEMVEELNPDVVTVDLIMPEMDGVTFLQKQMLIKPVPAVVVSIASETGETALQALDAGAVDIVQKPTALATEKIYAITQELISKVKTASEASLGPLQKVRPNKSERLSSGKSTSQFSLLAIGISTGGPQALRYILPQLSADFPVPVTVVIHMPPGYTALFAERLDRLCALDVLEADEGMEVKRGRILIAPAGFHLSFKQIMGKVVCHLDKRPFDKPHRPSVDVMFESAAKIYADRLFGVVMTGMGNDGQEGAAWIKSQGGKVFTEAEETCVVYGMPRSVDEASLSDRSVTLDHMIPAILETI